MRGSTPAAGTLNPSGGTLNWVGTSPGGSSPEGETSCVTNVTCESYTLTLSGSPADWAGKKARIVISAANAASDYAVYVHKGTTADAMGRPNGPIDGVSAGGPPRLCPFPCRCSSATQYQRAGECDRRRPGESHVRQHDRAGYLQERPSPSIASSIVPISARSSSSRARACLRTVRRLRRHLRGNNLP